MGAYKIAGGMIYALLLEIRCVNNRSVRYDTSKRTGKVEKPCDNLKLLKMIASIVGGDYSTRNTTSKTASKYKICDGQGGLGFNENEFKQRFDYGISHFYNTLLIKTQEMLKECIINDEEERLLFTKKVYLLLKVATNISDIIFTYLSKEYTRQEFLEIKTYDFPAFVLAVIHSIMTNVMNNKDGLRSFPDTFEYISSDTEYHFKKELISKLPQDISLINWESPADTISYDITDFDMPNPEIKKEPQPDVEETHTEFINATIVDKETVKNDETSQKNVNQRIINISGNGKYFEHVETLIIGDDDE